MLLHKHMGVPKNVACIVFIVYYYYCCCPTRPQFPEKSDALQSVRLLWRQPRRQQQAIYSVAFNTTTGGAFFKTMFSSANSHGGSWRGPRDPKAVQSRNSYLHSGIPSVGPCPVDITMGKEQTAVRALMKYEW